jgi:hypothetical protein
MRKNFTSQISKGLEKAEADRKAKSEQQDKDKSEQHDKDKSASKPVDAPAQTAKGSGLTRIMEALNKLSGAKEGE